MGPSDRVERGEEPTAVGRPARATHGSARAGPRPGDAAPSPEAAALGREEQEALLGAIERLSEPERLVVMPLPARSSEAETARTLAIGPEPSSRSRALGRLRDQLEGSRMVTDR